MFLETESIAFQGTAVAIVLDDAGYTLVPLARAHFPDVLCAWNAPLPKPMEPVAEKFQGRQVDKIDECVA